MILNCRHGANVNIVDETRIIRHHVIKTTRPLQCADYGLVSTFDDSNDAPFAPSFYPSRRRFRRYTRDDTISMHRCADVFRRNEDVRLARLFRGQKTVASWMDR